jgi:hypothetical protein
LKDAEPDKEPSSSQLAIAPCDEVLALEDSPSKLEEGLESKASEEDVEIGESSDEKDSNLSSCAAGVWWFICCSRIGLC